MVSTVSAGVVLIMVVNVVFNGTAVGEAILLTGVDTKSSIEDSVKIMDVKSVAVKFVMEVEIIDVEVSVILGNRDTVSMVVTKDVVTGLEVGTVVKDGVTGVGIVVMSEDGDVEMDTSVVVIVLEVSSEIVTTTVVSTGIALSEIIADKVVVGMIAVVTDMLVLTTVAGVVISSEAVSTMVEAVSTSVTLSEIKVVVGVIVVVTTAD